MGDQVTERDFCPLCGKMMSEDDEVICGLCDNDMKDAYSSVKFGKKPVQAELFVT